MVVLDFPGADGASRREAYDAPVRILRVEELADVRAALAEVSRALLAGEANVAVGVLSYDAAPAFDEALVAQRDYSLPLLWFALFDGPAQHEGGAREAFTLAPWVADLSPRTHRERIEAIREAIARGDLFQANLTGALRAQFHGDPRALYERLLVAQRPRYGALIDLSTHVIVSASPELFFDWDGDRIVTRPMKGTGPRGRFAEEDAVRIRELRSSAKDRAENVMIVDLLRSDLGRVARVGSVRVESLFDVEVYPTLLQLTSTISARTRDRTTLDALFAALFPCGSITGAPKVKATELIARLEEAARGVYTGAIGVVRARTDASGTRTIAATFSVAIRTMVLGARTSEATFGTGGGITWSSCAEKEVAEAVLKASFLDAEPFELLETLYLGPGGYRYVERHIARLLRSSVHFGFPTDEEAVRAALGRHAAAHAGLERRVRLLVGARGDIRVESTPYAPLPAGPLRVAIADAPIACDDRFLFHKTTDRRVYDARRASRSDVYDVLLESDRGELTEFTTGNLVVDIGRQRLTPPREAGLLPGILREVLLERGVITEKRLTREDMYGADGVWLLSALRGEVPVRLVDNPSSGG